MRARTAWMCERDQILLTMSQIIRKPSVSHTHLDCRCPKCPGGVTHPHSVADSLCTHLRATKVSFCKQLGNLCIKEPEPLQGGSGRNLGETTHLSIYQHHGESKIDCHKQAWLCKVECIWAEVSAIMYRKTIGYQWTELVFLKRWKNWQTFS